MAKKPTKEQIDEATRLQGYLDAIAKYEREFKKWETRSSNILKRYRDEERANTDDTRNSKFNILWSNVQILVPATFARVPQPDVSRRFRDQDPVGRVSAMILERGLEFETQHYPDYRDTMKQCVQDRFLGGRGTAWIRYEPHFKNVPTDEGEQITEDVEIDAPEEQLDYECAPVDYVHWKDFGHSVARTWEEVTIVWRKVYMSEDAVEKRFGEDIAKKIPYDSTPEDLKNAGKATQTDIKQQACVFELWDKEKGIAVWFSKSMKEFLDEKPDPLKLQHFFPCPKPLYATLTNDTLVPVPDFTLYQDQAKTLDTLADRSAGLVQMLQLKGVYDVSADVSLARLFTEGNNGNLIPVKNWAAFAEKNGLKGQVDVYDLTPIVRALEAVYVAAEQQKQQVYEIMGISDIVRGASNPNETLGAQELKGQYASMRLRAMQADVARFATDVLQMKAQVMCSKFNPKTLFAISAAEQLSEIDKQAIPQAMALLVGQERLIDPEAESPNPLRAFRIEVSADSMIQMNESQEKQDRVEFLTAVGGFIEKGAMVGAQAPQLVPLIMELLKFGVTGFKVGKQLEGTIDQYLDEIKQQAQQPKAPPPPDPKVVVEQEKLKIEQQRFQLEQQRTEAEMALKREESTNSMVLKRDEMLFRQNLEIENQNFKKNQEMDKQKFERTQCENENNMKKMIYQDELSKYRGEAQDGIKHVESVKTSDEIKALSKAIQSILENMNKPKKSRIIRGLDGRAVSVETIQ